VPEFNQNQFLNILSSTYSYISGVPSIWLGARKNAMSFGWLFLQGDLRSMLGHNAPRNPS
jgi:hypothetical protein